MPDVSLEEKAELALPLEKVGMSEIEMPVKVKTMNNDMLTLPARLDAFVSLDDTQSKGIHMSRLYEILQQVLSAESVSLKTIKHLLSGFVSSQKGLSEKSFVKLKFDLPLEREALVSGKRGWRHYPIFFEGKKEANGSQYVLGFTVAYSSTCPCSAALAKQVIMDQFRQDFVGENLIKAADIGDWLERKALAATPHAQRSYAEVKVSLDPETIAPEPEELINLVEHSLQTVVQAAVKREDEQQFARLNGENFMFCEDACRRIKKALNTDKRIIDYWVRVDHRESLHPHNAVSYGVKGVEGGFTA